MAALSVTVAVRPVHALCAGDCNGDGVVTVDELVQAVNIALEAGAYRLCPPTDTDQDGQVTVDEIIRAVGLTLNGCPETVAVFHAPETSAPAGPVGNGQGILPNGRRVTPVGTQIPTETLPLNVALTADGRYLLVTNDGYSDDDHRLFLQVIDTTTLAVTKTAVPQFFGLAITPQGDRVFVGSDVDPSPDRVDALRLHDGTLEREDQPLATLPDNTFPSGIALSPDGTHLYVVGMRANALLSIDLSTGAVHPADKMVGNLPYSVVITPDGQRALVTSWGLNNGNPPTGLVPSPLPPLDPNQAESSSLAEIDLSDPNAPRVLRHVRIARTNFRINHQTVYGGSHPSAMRFSPDGKFLYLTATNVDLLEVLDAATLQTTAEVPLNVYEQSGPLDQRLQGLYPNALAVSPDGRRVYVADAGIGAVQVIDVDPGTPSFTPAGFIPTGWYPTALALSPDGTRLYVANGKGTAVGPNGGPVFQQSGAPDSYIGQLSKGSVSIVDGVDHYDLAAGTAQVTANNGFTSADVHWVDGAPGAGEVQRGNPVPIDYGSGPSSLIQYVVFIFKENRTYDQILGSLPGANGDPSLEMFGADVTPNTRALATAFATGDNFFNDGEVSTLGHEWQDQGNCTDFTEKMWPSNYDRNLPSSVLEQGQEGFSAGGFIFESLERQSIPYRVYGETLALLSHFAAGIDGGGVGSIVLPLSMAFPGRLPNVDEINTIVNGNIDSLRAQGVDVDLLEQQVWPNLKLDYPMNILANFTDKARAQLFKQELDGFSAAGEMPRYVHIWLPTDHTFGGSAGAPTPRSAVADNDEGLGIIVDALTHSPFWPHMAIFVTEDDPQDGEDHVSAHRTISLLMSPYVKHGYISHVHHSNMSMIKTMWLLLGAHPLSMFDRYVTDMRDYFTTTPDLTPYTALPRPFPPEVNPSPANAPNVYLRRAATLSQKLNLTAVDLDGDDMSRILRLVDVGQQAERMKTTAAVLVCALLLALVGGGATLGRRVARRVA